MVAKEFCTEVDLVIVLFIVGVFVATNEVALISQFRAIFLNILDVVFKCFLS